VSTTTRCSVGNDVLIGDSGTDILLGDAGDDVLMSGYGRDYISGGAGVDAISYKGESRSVSIDLGAGIVRSDAQHNAVVLPAAGSIAGLPAAAFTAAGIEDLIGRIAVDPLTEVETFTSEAGSIENAEGSLGNDTIRGTTGANVLTGLAGDDVLDGRDGDDTAVFRGNGADYTSSNGDGSFTLRDAVAGRDGTDTVISIEHLQFADAALDIGSFVALNDALTVQAGQPVTINVLNNDVGAGLHVISVNGTPVTPNGTLVLANGSLKLIADGTALQFMPNAGFTGAVDFNHTIANIDGLLSTANVHLDLKANMAPTALVVENVATILETNGLAAVDSKVGDIVVSDDGMGGNVITLSGTDAALFRVIGSALFLRAGALLDAELKSSYSVHIAVSDPALGGPAVGTDFTLAIGNVNEAPTSVMLSVTSVLENAVAGTVVGTLSAIDPDLSDKVGFELTNSAGGAFALLGDQIVVANPTLLDFEVGGSKTVSVLATDAGGLQLSKDITITIADIAENVLTGTGGANTLNGGGGNDLLAGLAGDDTLNGNAGNDVLDGGAGKDNMAGGAGDDTYVVDNSGDKVTESSGQGTDWVVTTLSNYTLATNVENLTFSGSGAFQGRGNEGNNLVFGGTANDQLQGDKGNDTLVGAAAGNDTLDGGDGNDVLVGGQGSDSLTGGKGSDRLVGGAGNDVLSGGKDADVFVFRPGFGADVITDFAAAGTAHDALELTGPFHSLADLQAAHAISQLGTDTVITLNSDPAHLDQITLRGVALNTLTADHFLFL
jgi:Ca2+-binding RTX toxin-like protein